MKYYKLIQGNWTETQKEEDKREINLYDFINGIMIFIGIGQY